MEIYAVVFENDKAKLVSDDSLFAKKSSAEEFRDEWNIDFGACETRVAIIVPFTVQQGA